jgi:hypothetical protein
MAQNERTEYNFILRPVTPPDDDTDGIVDPDKKAEGYAFLSIPFNPDDDPEALMAIALEEVGIYDPEPYDIGGESEGGFIILDEEGDPFLSLESDDGVDRFEEDEVG